MVYGYYHYVFMLQRCTTPCFVRVFEIMAEETTFSRTGQLFYIYFYILWYELYVYIFYAFTAAVIDTDSGFLAGTFTDYIDGARIYLEAPEVGQSNTER